jgi:hypothetical protein
MTLDCGAASNTPARQSTIDVAAATPTPANVHAAHAGKKPFAEARSPAAGEGAKGSPEGANGSHCSPPQRAIDNAPGRSRGTTAIHAAHLTPDGTRTCVLPSGATPSKSSVEHGVASGTQRSILPATNALTHPAHATRAPRKTSKWCSPGRVEKSSLDGEPSQ